MPTIQETISKAIKVKGSNILRNKDVLCVIIGDLSPNLDEELKFINRVYNDDVGKILYDAFIAKDIGRKEKLLKEADKFLDEENGRNPKWRERLLSYFRNSIFNILYDSVDADKKSHQTSGVQSISKTVNVLKNSNTTDAVRKPNENLIENKRKEALIEMTVGQVYEEKGQLEAAFEHYYKAATLGDAKGEFYVGYMYENGDGVKKDLKLAVEWYFKAANSGNRGAQHNLGYFYYTGTVIKQDYKLAFEYFMMAAKQGKADSMLNIGVMYENGQYVAKNYEKALKWYLNASYGGAENGEKFYKALLKRMNHN